MPDPRVYFLVQETGLMTTRGKRMVRLREAFGPEAKIEVVAEGAGTHRADLSKAEGDRTQWSTRRFCAGIARCYGMTWEQLEAYMDGHMLYEDAVRLARPTVERAIRKRRNKLAWEARVEAAYERVARESTLPLARSLTDNAMEYLAECDGEVSDEDLRGFLERMGETIRREFGRERDHASPKPRAKRVR